LSRAVARYLTRHALPDADIADALAGTYCHAVVIPACREPRLAECLDAVVGASIRKTLILCVVNAREDATAETHQTNAETLEKFNSSDRSFSVTQLSSACDLLLINRAQPGRFLSPKRGVGTARRIGSDIALKLWDRGGLTSGWIHSTDADARVPGDYLRSPDAAVGRVIPFHHKTERPALMLYEIGLRLYALGLARATSPYAFQTVGSALAFRCEAYAQVGGFPEREAGEDFYLLNKLAKVGPILRSTSDPIVLVDRDSDRVPFGTGPGARKVQGELKSGLGFRTYDPRSFEALGYWNRQLRLLSQHRDLARIEAEMRQYRPDVWSCLEELDVKKALVNAVENTRKEADLRGRLFRHFDAFRTLRFVHLLRDRVWPLVPWREAVNAAASSDGFDVPESADLRVVSSLIAVTERGQTMRTPRAGLSA